MVEYIRKPKPTLTLTPIGLVYQLESSVGLAQKFSVRHQPTREAIEQGVVRAYIELNNDSKLVAGLRDLEGFSHIWLLWWFHLNETWRPLVLPPRGRKQKRGVFATRSPHRPNAIAQTATTLHGIAGRRIFIGDCDAISGTPVFDIRPYIAQYDAFPAATNGWIGEVEAQIAASLPYEVEWSELAQAQAAWLREQCAVDFTSRVDETLRVDPSPHRTRRIKRAVNNLMRFDCGAWRVFFSIDEPMRRVTVKYLTAGFPLSVLNNTNYGDVPDGQAQLSFLTRWPEG